MTFGREIPQRVVRTLDLRRVQVSRDDRFLRTFQNGQVKKPGQFSKRRGYSHALHRVYPGPVQGIISSQYCFTHKDLLLHIDDRDRSEDGTTGQIIKDSHVPARTPVPSVSNLVATEDDTVPEIVLTWDLPAFQWLSGIRIMRSTVAQPTGTDDPNASSIYDGAPKSSHDDTNVVINTVYYYAVFCYADL